MFDGLGKRVVCMWFPRLGSDRVLKARPVEAPFALTLTDKNAERIYCLNAWAETLGLHRGMRFAKGARPVERVHWWGLSLTTGRATGPERIAPEWWLEEESWRSGVRDCWKIDTPQTPGWGVQGEFI